MYRQTQRILGCLAAAGLLGHCLAAGEARATAALPADPSSYSVRMDPSQPATEIGHGYFSLSLKAGESKTVRILVENNGKTVLNLSNYSADATQIEAGGLDYGAQNTRLKAVGATITVRPTKLAIAPGKTKLVRAVITMPANAGPGDYVGGVVMENMAVQAQGAGAHVQIKVHYRQVIAILDTVPGKLVMSARIGKVGLAPILSAAQAADYLRTSAADKPRLKGSQATVVVTNTGNVLWRGFGVLHIGGLKAGTNVPFTVGTILAHSRALVTVQMPELDLTPGSYNMSVSLRSATKGNPLEWSGLVGLALPVAEAAATAVPNLALQPAQPVAAGAATTLNHGSPVSTTSSSPSALVLFGGGALVLLILAVGLGVVRARRSSARKPLPG